MCSRKIDVCCAKKIAGKFQIFVKTKVHLMKKKYAICSINVYTVIGCIMREGGIKNFMEAPYKYKVH